MLENIRKKWQERIERNAIESKLTYANKKGIKLMKEKGLSVEELPTTHKVTETVIFKRSLLPLGDWSRIYPPINERGKINFANLIFGGWRNLIKLIFILGIIAMIILQFFNDFTLIEKLREANELCNINIPDIIN